MKKFLTAGAALVGFGLSNLALAVDGTITFQGEVSSKTCTIENESLNQTVTLPVVSQSSLESGDKNAGFKDFHIAVSACTAGTKVKAHFEPGPTIDTADGMLKNQLADGSNVKVQIFNKSGLPINLATGTNNLEEVTGGDSAAKLTFKASYHAPKGETLKPGLVQTSVAYTLTYE